MEALAAAVLLIALQEPADFSKVDRKIAKEPKYLANPLYGLIVFDPDGKSKVWFVLDRSSPEMKEHDILYLDRNGNSDLTEPGERIVTAFNDGGTVVHEAGSVKLSEKGPEHTHFRLYASMAQRGVAPFFRIKLRGQDEVWGGFNGRDERTTLGGSPEKAPVFVADLSRPLTFQLFMPRYEFRRGDPERIALVVGVPGHGPATFMAVHEDFLIPGKDRLFGTWIAKNKDGNELRERFEIRSHC